MKRIYFLLFIYCGLLLPINAASILQINTIQLANEAELVFEAEVVSTRTEHSPGANIYTWVDFLVTDSVLGDAEAGHIITLRFTGGVVGDLKLDVGSDIPSPGERGIYFVEARNKQLANPLLGWSQGHFKIQRDGSLLAGNDQIVIAIDAEQRSLPKYSQGIANGIKTTTSIELKFKNSVGAKSLPVSVTKFKSFIKGLKKQP